MKDTKKIRIQRVSTWSIIVTIVLAVIFAAVSESSEKEFQVLRQTTDEYILCQNSAKELQDGSDYLTEQVRMYAMTGKTEYRDLYFEEANTTRRREKPLEELKKYFADTDSFTALETALSRSQELMETEYYSMRLVAESYGKSEESLPEEIRDVQLSTEDGTPAVSLSVGVAFADRENPGESIFKDADKVLYRVKENGRNGCDFY